MRFPSVALSLQLEQPALILRHEQVDQGGRRGAADRVRTALLTQAMIVERARARGGSEREYMAGNLLGLEVTAADVAQAFVACTGGEDEHRGRYRRWRKHCRSRTMTRDSIGN